MELKKYSELIRVRQWYKNVVVFLALFFSRNVAALPLVYQAMLAFVSLSLLSSAGYIINDLIDLNQDRQHPDKKNRPLASGKISKAMALVLAVLLVAAGLGIALSLGNIFTSLVLLFIALSVIYSLLLKKIILADVLTIATLFVLRAIAGAEAINVVISPWLILVPFFLSLFLSVGKRHGDIVLLKEKATSTRPVLDLYTLSLTHSLMTIATTLLIISYALYSFLSPYNYLLYTLPFALFTIFRFYYLINNGSEIARQPEKVIKDWPMMIGIMLWLISAIILIYL